MPGALPAAVDDLDKQVSAVRSSVSSISVPISSRTQLARDHRPRPWATDRLLVRGHVYRHGSLAADAWSNRASAARWCTSAKPRVA